MSSEHELSEYVRHYLHELRKGDSENAWFSLIEANSSIVPLLENAYYQENDVSVKAQIIEIVSHHRLSESIEFLANELKNSEPCLWKAALDGLVMQPSRETLKALEKVSSETNDPQSNEWIKEAIGQMRDSL